MNDQLRRFWGFGGGARGLWRELLMIAACIGIGVIVMPCLIFAVGRIALGPYAHGSVFALWRDFMIGLVSGSQAVWFIVLGSFVMLSTCIASAQSNASNDAASALPSWLASRL